MEQKTGVPSADAVSAFPASAAVGTGGEQRRQRAETACDVPDIATGRETRHAGMMGLTLAAVVFYVLYFGRYERKLLALRREAARVESSYFRRIRTENGE